MRNPGTSLAPETAGGAAMFGATGQPGGMFAATGGGGGLSASQAAKKSDMSVIV